MARGSSALVIIGLLSVSGLLRAVELDESFSDGDDVVNVLRCCRPGQDLEKPGPDGQVRCSASDSPFQPLVYSPEDNAFLETLPSRWKLHEDSRPRCSGDRSLRYLPSSKSNPYFLFESGTVLTELEAGVELVPHEYCLGSSALLACMPKSEGQPAAASAAAETLKPRIRKCCGENAAYERNSCVEIEDEVRATLQSEKDLLLGSRNSLVGAGLELTRGFPVCQQSVDKISIVSDTDQAQLNPDGSLIANGRLIPKEDYCIERLRVRSREVLPAKVFACVEHAPKGSSQAVQVSDIRFTLYPAGLIISAIFLAATLGTGWLLPASHHVLHWRCQTYHVACLMLGDICMAVIQLSGDSLRGTEFCRVFAILAHFFFLATFFWLNTMCFNIWWTFRDLRPTSLEKGQELVRLRFYAAYAWGGPLVVAGLAAILDHMPQGPEENILRPHFGEKQCWFIGDTEIFVYFYGPIGILLAINLLFFAATARELTCGLWKGELVKSNTERSRALPRTNENESARDRSNRRAALGKVCLKLVVVMGVPWIFDVLSWWVGGPNFLWYVTDSLNALQGVFIFIVVGCQPQVRASLKRLWLRNPHAGANRMGNGLSTTSNGISGMGDSLTQNPSTKTANLETIC